MEVKENSNDTQEIVFSTAEKIKQINQVVGGIALIAGVVIMSMNQSPAGFSVIVVGFGLLSNLFPKVPESLICFQEDRVEIQLTSDETHRIIRYKSISKLTFEEDTQTLVFTVEKKEGGTRDIHVSLKEFKKEKQEELLEILQDRSVGLLNKEKSC